MESIIELTWETIVSVMVAVSAWSLVVASFLRMERVDERHWLMGSAEEAAGPRVSYCRYKGGVRTARHSPNDDRNFSICVNSLDCSADRPTK